MKNRGVIYSIATRLGGPGLGTVAYNAAKALGEYELLDTVVSYGNSSDIPKSNLFVLPGNPAKLLFFLPRHYYKPMRKGFLDFATSMLILRRGCRVFHGWNNQALRSIKAAAKTGAASILECGSTHPLFREKVLEEEYERYGLKAPRTPSYAREASLREIALADRIFLTSDFARKTFADFGVDEKKIFVINRGADLKRFSPPVKRDERFRVLFLGRVSLRKGVQYLLEAWKRLGLRQAELVLAGAVSEEMKQIVSGYREMNNIYLAGYLRDPAPIYKTASVFVFPSIEEGSAKVNYEAMASGVPVITTPNSGSPVRDGIDGFIIPIRSVEAIMEKLQHFYDNREEIGKMGDSAADCARSYTWERYRHSVVSAYREMGVL